MNPHLRMSGALVMAAVIWLPTALNCVRGTTPLDDAAVGRLILAFVFSWVATGGLAWLVDAYTRAAEDAPVEAELLVEHERRRGTD